MCFKNNDGDMLICHCSYSEVEDCINLNRPTTEVCTVGPV